MIYGNKFLPTQEVIQEGFLKKAWGEVFDDYKNAFKQIFDGIKKSKEVKENKKREEQEKKKAAEDKKNFFANYDIEEIASSLKLKDATGADLDKLYKTEAFAIEGLNAMFLKNKKEMIPAFIEKFVDSGIYLVKNITIYVADGSTVNKYYDLEGDNAYESDFHITLISFDDFKTEDSGKISSAKYALNARYWRDVVDNNEYREYKKGRHKATKNIQWLIDAKGE